MGYLFGGFPKPITNPPRRCQPSVAVLQKNFGKGIVKYLDPPSPVHMHANNHWSLCETKIDYYRQTVEEAKLGVYYNVIKSPPECSPKKSSNSLLMKPDCLFSDKTNNSMRYAYNVMSQPTRESFSILSLLLMVVVSGFEIANDKILQFLYAIDYLLLVEINCCICCSEVVSFECAHGCADLETNFLFFIVPILIYGDSNQSYQNKFQTHFRFVKKCLKCFENAKPRQIRQLHQILERRGQVKASLIPAHSGGSDSLLILTQNSIFTICWISRQATSPLAKKKIRESRNWARLGPSHQNLAIKQPDQETLELQHHCNDQEGLDCGKGRIDPACNSVAVQGDESFQLQTIKTFRDEETGIVEKTFEEQTTNIKLEQPPSCNPRDQRQRLQTFQGRRNILCSPENLATAGFYLTRDNLAVCYSCHIHCPIEDFLTEQSPFSTRFHESSCQHLSRFTQQQQPSDGGRTASDGRVSDDIADPPGQQSIYIPPGDVRREAYRLSTFEHFPVACPISRKSLAKSGFTFTGFYDRVKCFACGRTVERWEERDNPAELRWHKPTCPFPRGGDSGNVPLPSLFASVPLVTPGAASSSAPQRQPNPTTQPAYPGEQVVEQLDPNTGQVIRRVRYPPDLPERIRQSGGTFEIGPNNQVIIRSGPGPAPRDPANVGIGSQPRRQWRMANVISADHKRFVTNLFLNRELDRLASFARWPVARPNIAPAYLAKSGFFYLGDMDRTQCFSCGGVLRNWSLDDDATAEHRTHFPQCRMVLGNEPRNIPLHEHPETEEEKEERYPCRFPSNPHMRSEQARLGTFDRRWPMGRTAATPAEIAQGGFFFLGERDRAKCWYCNGGLQNWEYDDIPWIEHAKWFPNCQFLLRVKGQHFVYRHLALNPHLARPIIARQDGSPLEAVGQPAQGAGAQAPRAQDISPSEPRVRQPTPPPTIIDPQEEMRKRKERVENIMNNSEVVKVVLSMGFEKKIVAALLEDRINSGNVANPNDIYESVGLLLDDVMKKEEELKKEEEERRIRAAAAATPNPSLSGPNSFRTMSSLYSGVSSASGLSSLGPSPGSGKYNVSYYGDDDEDERMNRDMYGSMEGTSASITSVTSAKRLHAAEENPESLREALNKIEEERMCKICFTNAADMVFVPCSHMCCCMECTQAIRQCPVCRKKIDKAIKTYVN